MYHMQMSNEKWKSVIPCFNLIKIINDGRLVISFVDVPEKNSKPLKLLLQGGAKKGRGTHV